jgi:hypothetical protein
MVFWHTRLGAVPRESQLCVYVFFFINPGFHMCFVGEAPKNWRQAGTGLRTCYSSRFSGGTFYSTLRTWYFQC